MRLCMFHPLDHPMERGWVGRIDGEHVIHLAAQTLQSFFTGGGAAREHAVYPLAGVRLLAPVLHPPSIRSFESGTTFAFANPAAVRGPDALVPANSPRRDALTLLPRLAAVIGADERVVGFTVFAEWRKAGVEPPKDRDFALGLGPVVVTPDELETNELEAIVRIDGTPGAGRQIEPFDWLAARDLAADETRLYPGDLIAGPAATEVAVPAGSAIEIEVAGIGVLAQRVASDVRQAQASDR